MLDAGAEVITAKDFEEKVLKSKKVVAVDFLASWCGPCQIMSPKVDNAAKKYADKIGIYKVDIEKSSELASKYSVLSVPTLIFFKNGKPIDQAGFLDESQLTKMIEELTS